MDVPFGDLATRFNLEICGILHVGAHLAQEAEHYHELRIAKVWWVEANPDLKEGLQRHLKAFPNQRALSALIADCDGKEMPFNVTKNVDPLYNGVSSSIFELGDHLKYDPDTYVAERMTLTSTTIDTLRAANGIEANCLVLDIQGAELLALRGARQTLSKLDYIYTEVSTGPVYVGGALISEIDDFLSGFSRVHTDLWMLNGTHGNALYVRQTAPMRLGR